MGQVKPIYIFSLLVLVHVIMAGLLWFFPNGKIPVNQKLTLSFFPAENLLKHKEVVKADITAILQKASLNDSLLLRNEEDIIVEDTVSTETLPDSLYFTQEYLTALSHKIQYEKGNENVLQPFFNVLKTIQNKQELIRIMHFGDSQIEGDRITSVLRAKIQRQFGGCGTGLLSLFEVSDIRPAYTMQHSKNWKKYAIYGNLNKGAGTKQFGVLGSFFKYFVQYDTLGNALPAKAWTKFIKRGTQKYEQLTLYYANTKGKSALTISTDKKIIAKDTLRPMQGFNYCRFPIDTIPKEVKLSFAGPFSPHIYGVGFDCNNGVAVDNISMRGSSGTDFHFLDKQYFAKQLEQLNVKLIIFQFGVNVIPYIKDDDSYYENRFYKELKALKDNNPGIPILVIGVSDMSTKAEGKFVSYRNVTKVRDAQRNAAFKAGCAFWDLYEAMGGENSMVAWVNAKPRLAEQDYTHFNQRGSKIVGDMIFNALMKDYLQYAQKNL